MYEWKPPGEYSAGVHDDPDTREADQRAGEVAAVRLGTRDSWRTIAGHDHHD
jgi:hypothetical protein